MRLLDRHIARELIGPFLFGVAAFTSIMFAGRELFEITELLAEYGAPLIKAVELVVLFLPSLVVMTLPMAMLLSALLGFGRLSGDSEVVALFAGGISMYRVALPVAVMAIVVTAGSFVLSEVIAPRATVAHDQLFTELKNESATTNKPLLWPDTVDGVTEGVYYIGGGFDAKRGVAKEVTVIRYADNKPAVFIFGKEAIWKGEEHPEEWSFTDGYWKSLAKDQSVTMPFAKLSVRLAKKPDQVAMLTKDAKEMNFSELRSYIHMMEDMGQDVKEQRVELYQKISMPLASLVFALIGVPLGLRPQRSSSAMGLGLAVVIIFAYWVLMHYMTILGENGAIPPAAASFIPTLLGVGAGVFLISKAAK